MTGVTQQLLGQGQYPRWANHTFEKVDHARRVDAETGRTMLLEAINLYRIKHEGWRG